MCSDFMETERRLKGRYNLPYGTNELIKSYLLLAVLKEEPRRSFLRAFAEVERIAHRATANKRRGLPALDRELERSWPHRSRVVLPGRPVRGLRLPSDGSA
jgi:hypothetical protein